MKKIGVTSAAVMTGAIIGVFCFLYTFGTYYDTQSENKRNKMDTKNYIEEEKLPQVVAAAEIKKISAQTNFIYEYYYENDERIESSSGKPPHSLIGKDIEDVKKYYSDWQIRSFSTDKVVMRKVIEADKNEKYVVGIHNGYITVFYEEKVNGESIYFITDKSIDALSHEEQVLLNDGILVRGKDRLNRILEDYGS